MKVRTLLSALVGTGLLALGAAGVGAWTSSADGASIGDPFAVTRISLVSDGLELGTFAGIYLTSGFEPTELALGTRGIALPAKRTPPSVTLKRGMNGSRDLSMWHEAALVDFVAARRNASLVLYDAEGTAVARYTLENAWPAKVELGEPGAGTAAVLMETVTLVSDRIQRVAP